MSGVILNSIFSAAFLTAIIRMTTPVLLSAIGDVYCERTGVLNIAQEGMMLMGAFVAFLGGYYNNGNPYAGLVTALVVGLAIGAAFAVFVVTLGCNQIVTALGINMLGLGITSTFNKFLFGITTTIPKTQNMPTLFGQSAFFYIALILVPITYIILQKTKWGLKLRAIGEYPRAAATVGINVYRHRYIACIISGALSALGGASLTIGGLGYFQENMVAGRGFIAFAAVIFGRYNPVGTLVACLIFGAADALQLNLQSLGVTLPYHMFIMMPYVVTILVLVISQQKSFVPRAQGTHYIRDQR
ncbi:MAG: ABC transporter permease [Bacillota bacterium]